MNSPLTIIARLVMMKKRTLNFRIKSTGILRVIFTRIKLVTTGNSGWYHFSGWLRLGGSDVDGARGVTPGRQGVYWVRSGLPFAAD